MVLAHRFDARLIAAAANFAADRAAQFHREDTSVRRERGRPVLVRAVRGRPLYFFKAHAVLYAEQSKCDSVRFPSHEPFRNFRNGR